MALTWCKGLQRNGWANQVGTWRMSISNLSKVKTVGIVKWHKVYWILWCIIANQSAPKLHKLRIFKNGDSIKKHYGSNQKLSQEIWVFEINPFSPTHKSQSLLDDLEGPQHCRPCICQSFIASFQWGSRKLRSQCCKEKYRSMCFRASSQQVESKC